MKQNRTVKKSGPYFVNSHSQGDGTVHFSVYPAFTEYNDDEYIWAESRFNREGGGPSIFTSMAVAKELEEFLNSVYTKEEIGKWKEQIESILEMQNKNSVMAECETCGTVFSMPSECKYCPWCGNKYKIITM